MVVEKQRRKKTMSEINGNINVCCHNVFYTYDIGRLKNTEELREQLAEVAEERAKECISNGYREGELNCVWKGEQEIRGWWKIDNR